MHTLGTQSPWGLSFGLHELMRNTESGSLIFGLMVVVIGVLFIQV